MIILPDVNQTFDQLLRILIYDVLELLTCKLFIRNKCQYQIPKLFLFNRYIILAITDMIKNDPIQNLIEHPFQYP